MRLRLPGRVLPLFAAWPWPGNSLEGHKDAKEFLGPTGAPAAFALEYRAGYAAFAAAGWPASRPPAAGGGSKAFLRSAVKPDRRP